MTITYVVSVILEVLLIVAFLFFCYYMRGQFMIDVYLSPRADLRQDRGQCHLRILLHGQALPSVVFTNIIDEKASSHKYMAGNGNKIETVRSDGLGYCFATRNQNVSRDTSVKSIFSERSALSSAGKV